MSDSHLFHLPVSGRNKHKIRIWYKLGNPEPKALLEYWIKKHNCNIWVLSCKICSRVVLIVKLIKWLSMFTAFYPKTLSVLKVGWDLVLLCIRLQKDYKMTCICRGCWKLLGRNRPHGFLHHSSSACWKCTGF